MHVDFALPVDHDLLAGWDAWQRKAADGVMDYGFHMAVTSWSDKVGVHSSSAAAGNRGATARNKRRLDSLRRRVSLCCTRGPAATKGMRHVVTHRSCNSWIQ